MNRLSLAYDDPHYGDQPALPESAELRFLFHRLNNQLGIILAHAELMEAKAGDATGRARASQVVASVLEAMSTAKEIRIELRPGKAVGR